VLLGTIGLAPRANADDGWAQEPVASSEASGQACARLMFVGVRGSGEDPGYGRTITEIRDRIGAMTDIEDDVRQVWLDYPAVALSDFTTDQLEDLLFSSDDASEGYRASVLSGVDELQRLLADEGGRCPSEKVLLVGYSQGAEVVTRTLSVDPLGDRLLGAVLAGNPAHFEGQHVTEDDSTSSESAYGMTAALEYLRTSGVSAGSTRDAQVQGMIAALFAMYDGDVDATDMAGALAENHLDLDDSLTSRVHSVCMAGDMICDAVPTLTRILSSQTTFDQERERARPLHSNYSSVMPLTMNWLEAALKRLALEPEPSPTPSPGGGTTGWWIWVVAGGGVLLVVAGAAIVSHRRGRPAKPGKTAVDDGDASASETHQP